ncbi:MAG: dipeptidase PepE [Bacteroidales bacterium]|nr:dipeptidase PepE [Bacteroidales bacterium]
MKALLLSNSTMPGESYLGWCKEIIVNFFRHDGIHELVFVPYAGVNLDSNSIESSYDAYTQKVATVLKEYQVDVIPLHREVDPAFLIKQAKAILVGGGNTFYLVYKLHELGLMNLISDRVKNEGVLYAGWSAGANIACPGLFTTNDMPIIQPISFSALQLIPFQINPHYTDVQLPQHGGETRRQRIAEFLQVNRQMKVIGLPEGTYILVDHDNIVFHGQQPALWFEFGKEPVEIENAMNLSRFI